MVYMLFYQFNLKGCDIKLVLKQMPQYYMLHAVERG